MWRTMLCGVGLEMEAPLRGTYLCVGFEGGVLLIGFGVVPPASFCDTVAIALAPHVQPLLRRPIRTL